jgi:hypothetical protein
VITIDRSAIYRQFLSVVAGALLVISALFLAGVLERWVAAAWMAYKFSGLSSDGFITLSAGTALVYIPTGLVLLALSYSNMLFARKKQSSIASSMSKYAAILFLIAIILYVLLGFSPLNQWRT